MKNFHYDDERFDEQSINESYYKKMDYPKNKTLDQLFYEQAVTSPYNTALVHGQQKLSYSELNGKTNILANILKNNGVKRNTVVSILSEQSVELIIGIISVLKAGGAFLVIDPDYPEDRVSFMLKDSKTEILLTKSALIGSFEFKGLVIALDNLDESVQTGDKLETIGKPEDLAYILYTSGTTGVPKGVMVEHRNSINALYYLKSQVSADISTRVVQFFSPSFSVSYQEIFITLLFGGTLFIIDGSTRRNIEKLLDFIAKAKINVLFLPSSYLKLMINEEKYFGKLTDTIEHIVIAGEQIVLTDEFIKYLSGNSINFYNNYGTSESHLASMLNVNDLKSKNGILPIGKPIANTFIYILDEYLLPQPVGKEGEIYISGDSVGRGYLNNPELTEKKFIENPFVKEKIMYKTGDLGKWLPDGHIQLLGRTDYQVKIRGFRIELEDIEYNLLKYPLIKEAVVVAREGSTDGKFLHAYILSDKPIQTEEIKKFLSAKLPEYMIPAYIIRLNELPRTIAGKIDRKALIENRTVLLNDDKIAALYSNCSSESILIVNEIKVILESITGNEFVNICPDDDFAKLGLDSISLIKLVADIENKFGLEFDDDRINNGCQTIKELISCIEEKTSLLNGGRYET